MTELIGDPCIPSVLIVPTDESAGDLSISGAKLFLSGSKLWFREGAVNQVITSA